VKFEAHISWVPCLTLPAVTRFRHARELAALVTRWNAAGHLDKARSQLELASLFLEIAADSRYERVTPLAVRASGRTQWLLDTIDHIAQRTEEEISVADLAGRVHMGPDHFTRLFRAKMGLTPLLYLQRAKVEKAKMLLQQGLSCKQTSTELGYRSPAHFSHAFKRLTNTTPSQWVRTIREPA